MLADCVGYYIGKHKGRALFKESSWFFKPKYLEKTDAYFKSHGGKSVFVGRFIGVVRPFVSVTAGMHHMKFSKFLFYNVTSGLLWTVAYVLIGFFFGEQVKPIMHFINHSGYIVLATLATFVVGVYIWKKWACKKKK